MTDEQQDLARRLVACAPLDERDDRNRLYRAMAWVYQKEAKTWKYIPDLSDYATAAILLRMAIEQFEFGHGSKGHTTGWIVGDATHAYCTAMGVDDLGIAAARALLAIWEEPEETDQPGSEIYP